MNWYPYGYKSKAVNDDFTRIIEVEYVKQFHYIRLNNSFIQLGISIVLSAEHVVMILMLSYCNIFIHVFTIPIHNFT